MSGSSIEQILNRLNSGEQEAAWGEFLKEYSSLIFQVVRHFERDDDRSSDCFQFVCEQLVKDRFRRLRRFNADGPATFPTWLRAVVRNLCLDKQRKERGRLRTFRSVLKLSAIDQEVFRSIYERGNSIEDTASTLVSNFPDLTADGVSESVERIGKELTTNQRWLIRARFGLVSGRTRTALEVSNESDLNVQDSSPDPEAQAIRQEERTALRRVLNRLPKRERVLLRLRFLEELTLEQIARLLNLGNAQRVDRQIKAILARLRDEMSLATEKSGDGKKAGASVKTFGEKRV